MIGSSSTSSLLFYGPVAAAVILLGALFAFQALHDRRLRTFGNPRLFGFGGPWPRRICSAVLQAVAAGSLVSLIGSNGIDLSGADSGLTVYLVDPLRSSEPLHVGSAWEDYLGDLRQVIENLSSDRISVFISGSPPRLIVPPTRDVAGALQLLDAGSPHYEPSNAATVTASVEAVRLILSRMQGGQGGAVPLLVVISPRSTQEIDLAAGTVRRITNILFVRSTMGKGALEYRRDKVSTQWNRLNSPGSWKSLSGYLSRSLRGTSPPDVQVLALIAFLSLFLECTLCIYRPAGGRLWPLIPRRRGEATGGTEKAAGAIKPMVVLAALLAIASSQAATIPSQQAGGAHRILQEAVNPHLAVITEVSNEQPYVGEQFSVVYRLRCSIPPAAVDVDPQDITGFWTVTAPTRGEARAETVTLNGRPATDFLLRQLIAFPLRPGRQVFPPLRLKIKQQVGSREDWDLKVSTQAVEVEVRAVPAAGEARDGYLMVGSLAGGIEDAGPDGAHEAVLEIEGTANLDFFGPEEWLKCLDGPGLQIRLKDQTSLVQTRDYEGKRRLSLLQRQRWAVSDMSHGNAAVEVASFSIPYFDPEASKWRMLDFPSFVLGTGSDPSRAAQALHHDREAVGQSHGSVRGPWTYVGIASIVSVLALLLVVIAESRERARARPAAFAGQGRQTKVLS